LLKYLSYAPVFLGLARQKFTLYQRWLQDARNKYFNKAFEPASKKSHLQTATVPVSVAESHRIGSAVAAVVSARIVGRGLHLIAREQIRSAVLRICFANHLLQNRLHLSADVPETSGIPPTVTLPCKSPLAPIRVAS
jgi:hypothetical protein